MATWTLKKKKKSETNDRKIVEDYGSPMKSCLTAFWKSKLKHYKEEILRCSHFSHSLVIYYSTCED